MKGSGSKDPLRLEVRGDVWWVYFNTPGSVVNIFTQAAAESVLALSERAQREGPDAVVFATEKEKSFINGAQLMMASAVQSCDDVFPLTDLLRRAYRSVRELEMLTVAAVQGACYGCGVEFTLNFDHRLAADSGHTQFYMTELADYLNTPAFGSTQRLVRKMPLPAAVEFLMWGRRLRAADAVSSGLASKALGWQGFEAQVTAVVEELLSGTFQAPSPVRLDEQALQEYEASVWEIIEGLPADYRQIHRDCFRLMLHAKKKADFEAGDERLELEACGRSLVTPGARRARSVLFVRQLAERVCVRRPPPPQKLAVVLDGTNPHLADLRQVFDEQNHPRSQVVDRVEDLPEEGVGFRFFPLEDVVANSESLEGLRCLNVAASAGIGRRLSNERPGVIFHRPAPALKAWDEQKQRPRGGATALIELAIDASAEEKPNLFFDYLTDFDTAVIYSRPEDYFASDVLALAFLAPLAAFVAGGGSISTVGRSLHDFGFLQMPWELSPFLQPSSQVIGELSRRVSSHWSTRELEGGLEVLLAGEAGEGESAVDVVLVDAILLSLLHACAELLELRVLDHVALVDVIACELLGFPITRGTFGQFITATEVGKALRNRSRLEGLLATEVLEHAETFRQAQRGYYG